MRKIILMLIMVCMTLCFALPVFADDPTGDAPTILADNIPTAVNLAVAPAVSLPTEADIVQLFPNAAKVDGVATYLFIAKSVAIGPSYTIVKLYNLVNGDIQFASITKGGSYIGAGLSAEFVDIIKKFGRDPAFNPSIGITGGYRTSVGELKAGFDGGIRAKILNVDTDKLVKWLGL